MTIGCGVVIRVRVCEVLCNFGIVLARSHT